MINWNMKDGQGKKYYENGQIEFDGEFLYGDKIKGKEYHKSKVEYEEEFLYNKKWNGKGYDEDGNVIYELNNGNGNVKEYNGNGKLIFEGEKGIQSK